MAGGVECGIPVLAAISTRVQRLLLLLLRRACEDGCRMGCFLLL
jgi:hypothetical protein